MKRALVFPGQGSQKIGMGKGLYDAFTEAKAVFQEVDEALKQDLSKLIFEGSEEDLKLTENAQPALMTVSMAVVRVLEKQGKLDLARFASYVAGHSLGEFAALCAAGSFSLADTAKLLRLRGKAMQQAVPAGVGGMVALLGVDVEKAAEIAAEAAQGDVCASANDNAPGQVVISGHVAALDRAIAIAAAQGFKRSVRLPVSAPFHSPLMQPAAEAIREALANVTMRDSSIPIVPNATATATSDSALLRELLVRQVTGPVRWRETVLYMKGKGVEQIVECGSGSVLAGLVKRIDKELPAVSLHAPEDIEAFLKTL
jgi:[acyl-carrier-protein] S-malonyltransferase